MCINQQITINYIHISLRIVKRAFICHGCFVTPVININFFERKIYSFMFKNVVKNYGPATVDLTVWSVRCKDSLNDDIVEKTNEDFSVNDI